MKSGFGEWGMRAVLPAGRSRHFGWFIPSSLFPVPAFAFLKSPTAPPITAVIPTGRSTHAMTELPLQSDLGIESVADLQAALQPHLDDDAPVALNGHGVERVHAAGLQLLHAFVRDRAARGHQTTVTLASPILAAAARQLGLAVSLGVDPHSGEPA